MANSVLRAMTPKLRQRLEHCFQCGIKLGKHDRNYEYAHVMLTECVSGDPENLDYLEAFLDNLEARHGGQRKHLRRVLGNRREFNRSIGNGDWSRVLEVGAARLSHNPWHVATLRAMARACEELHYNDVELRYLKQALDANPNDAEVNRHCARSLARMGQFDQAVACWLRVKTIRKTDKEAARMISQLSVDKVRFAAPRADSCGKTQTNQQSSDTEVSKEQSCGAPSGDIGPCDKRPSKAARIEIARDQVQRKQPRWRLAGHHVSWLPVCIAATTLLLIFQLLPIPWHGFWIFVQSHLQLVLFVTNLVAVSSLLALRHWLQLRAVKLLRVDNK